METSADLHEQHSHPAEKAGPKLLVVENESIIALDLEQTLSRSGYSVIGVADSAQQALAFLHHSKPDLVLMDVHLQGTQDGIDAARVIGDLYNIPVVFLTAHADAATVGRASQTMPYGFLSKPWSLPQLNASIRIALQQHARLQQSAEAPRVRAEHETSAGDGYPSAESRGYKITPRQREVIRLIAEGKSNKEIASELNVSVKTVNFHKANLMSNLLIRTTAEITRFAIRHGIIPS